MVDIKKNVESVLAQIRNAAERVGRNPCDVKLVAAAKMVDAERVRRAVEAGVSIIGENKVQEAKEKISLLGHEAQWHFIGHLQRNKVKDAFTLFDMVQSVDSLPLAAEMEKRGNKMKRVMDVLIEVNLGGEETKFGIVPEDVGNLIREISSMSHLKVKGLMTIPPLSPDPEDSRPFFRKLKELAEEIDKMEAPNISMEELSMGMTGDFQVAVEEGATMVRIGTAIFGPRQN